MAIPPRDPCWNWWLPPPRRNNYRTKRQKRSGRMRFGPSTSTRMGSAIGRLICLRKCRNAIPSKMWHDLQKGISRIIRFLSGTPRMGCWCWDIPKTAIPSSPAITIPSRRFAYSPPLCWACWDWMCCASFSPTIFPNAESFTIPSPLYPRWKRWRMESPFPSRSAANYRKLQAASARHLPC